MGWNYAVNCIMTRTQIILFYKNDDYYPDIHYWQNNISDPKSAGRGALRESSSEDINETRLEGWQYSVMKQHSC